MKTLPQKLKEQLESGRITLHEAAREMHKAGFFNFVDEDGTRRFLANFKGQEDRP